MRKRSRESVVVDITSLIDVVFLLLIFFMTSTVFKEKEQILSLDLAQTKSGESRNNLKKVLLIEVSSEKIAYQGKKMTIAELERKLFNISNKKISLELRVDKEVKYLRLVKILEILKKTGLENLSLVTES